MASASTSLTTLSLTPDPSFNWFFLLELIVSCILVLFFLLYFNRLFATLLSYGIRAYTWHYYRAYVDIHALQISLIGGRIFFKGIRYHGVNETIFVHGGFITWHYWKRTVRQTDISALNSSNGATRTGDQADGADRSSKNSDSGGENGGLKRTDDLPCRIAIQLYGLEWFIYNRTPAYDSILAGFGHAAEGGDSFDQSVPGRSEGQEKDSLHHGPKETGQASHKPDVTTGPGRIPDRNETEGDCAMSENAADRAQEIGESLSRLLRLLPLRVSCDKGAIVVGNENTRSVLTTTFDSGTGLIEACNAGPFDLYRQIFSFQIQHPVIQMRPNPDYKQNQLGAANGLSSKREDQSEPKRRRDTIFSYQFQKRRVWHTIRDLIPYFQTSVESFHIHDKHTDTARNPADGRNDIRWAGLSRYLDESSQDDHEEWHSVEYARFSTILDSPSMDITYYWDIPGCVVSQQLPREESTSTASTAINGAPPPEWGIDIKLEGGSINYGPWADRERVGLQNVFFPNAYRSSQYSKPLAPGDLRINTLFKIRVEISEETTLRIPTKEPSKDWQWKGRADAIRGASKLKKQQKRGQSRAAEGDKSNLGPDIRPFGWLSLRVAADSTVSYTMDMVASSPSGFSNSLDLDLRESKLSSSVNHALLWECSRQFLTCDLSNPLCWNSLRAWKFDVKSHDMKLFLLRDHIFLLTDLVSDWASGPPQDYFTFVPFTYTLSLSFDNIKLYINVNDLNIISNPSDLDDNRMLVINGKTLTSDVLIPLTTYKPEQNAVKFNIILNDGGIDFLSPLWDTLHTFLKSRSTATLENLSIEGTYDYYLSTSSDLTDTLLLDIGGSSPRLYLFGFLIRSFMTIKDNYFGEEMHFRTLEEFQELAHSEERVDSHAEINPNRKSNDLDVVVHVAVDNPCALLPENLYDQLKCLRLTAPSLEVDLRFTNYYMDMQFSLSPLKVALEWNQNHGPPVISDTQLFIDGATVHGHRLFGLPPAEPTYVCNWDFEVGRILGECHPEFLGCLTAALQSFDMSFDNEENALQPLVPIALHDVTFLRAKIHLIHISVLLDQGAIMFSSGPITTKFNDWANASFSKRMSLLIPDLSIAAIDNGAAEPKGREPPLDVPPLALFQTTVNLRMAQRRCDIIEGRKLQQEHIRVHDQRTQRTPWLIFDWEDVDPESSHVFSDHLAPPTIPMPLMPDPLMRRFNSFSLSARSLLDNTSQRSSRSFILSSNVSSIMAHRHRTNDNLNPAPNSELGAEDDQEYSQANWKSGGQTFISKKHRQYRKELRSTTGPAIPNAWMMPNFSLCKILLDTSQLPLPQIFNEYATRESMPVTRFDPLVSPFEEDGETYTNFFCELPSGVRGLCSPEFLFMLSTLIEQLQPSHPIEIIDSLQKDVASDIIGYEKSMKHPKKSTSFAIRTPSIVVKMTNSSASSATYEVGYRDEYRIEVSDLKTELRTRVARQKGDLLTGVSKNSTIHAAAQNLAVLVTGGRADVFQEKAEFRCLLGDSNFWLVTAPTIRSSLQIRAFDTVTSTKSVEHLAFLVRRATTIFDSVASSFQNSSSISSRRLQFIIHSLAQRAGKVPDPAFLTRISPVLRVAPTHLRQHDSWKIISRVRNVYNHLKPEQQLDLAYDCLDTRLSVPENAKDTVLSAFDQWRAWDLAHVQKSYVMRRIWNDFEQKRSDDITAIALSLTVKGFRFSIDPGPKESDFVVENLSSRLTVSTRKGTQPEVGESEKNVTISQSYCSSAGLRLRWEILDLVEGVLKAISPIKLESAASTQVTKDKILEDNELQFIFGVDTGFITLDGINVKLALASRGFRSSLVHQSSETGKTKNLSVLLSAQTCSSELSSLSELLMTWRISDPYAYCSRVSEERQSTLIHEWKVAGSCRKLRYDMEEDPASLAHTADRVIADEIRYLHQLIKNIKLPEPQPQETPIATKPALNNFHIAMFLDDYRLSFSVLPSLTYVISGEVARMSVMPRMGSKIEVDFDLKSNSHTFFSIEGDRRHYLSQLEIPPINGRVLVSRPSSGTQVEVDATIELIRLEANAVRSLLGALTKPEVSHLVSDLKQNGKVLQLHLGETLALNKNPREQEATQSGHGLLYKARLNMAGTKIHATAPALNSKGYSADMDFNLGMMRIRLDNGLDNGRPMEFPEIDFDASNISFDLRKNDSSGTHSYCSIAMEANFQGLSETSENGESRRAYHLSSKKFELELFSETAALVVDIAAHLQDRIKTLDLSQEVKRLRRLRHRGHADATAHAPEVPKIEVPGESSPQDFLKDRYSLDLHNIQVGWNMSTAPVHRSGREPDDLVFSIKRVDLSNSRSTAAKLRIEDMQLQMVPSSENRRKRSLNSALMPELVFNVAYSSTGNDVLLAFQAAGKSLDIRATSDFILPASMIRDSIASASQTIREADSVLVARPSVESDKQRSLFGNKRIRSVLVDVDFAGAILSLQSRHTNDQQTLLTASLTGSRLSEAKYGQYVHGDAATTATLRAPGVALKVQFEDNGVDASALNAELKIDASSNVLYPTLVPLIKQMTSTIKEVMEGKDKLRKPSTAAMLQPQKLMPDTSFDTKDPASIFGRCKVNVGVLIRKQEFSLSCQPIARVAATAGFDNVYITINTVQSHEQGRFLAVLIAFNSLQASVKHVYSNESTASFDVKSIVVSLMNSKHLSSSNGISAVLRISPMQMMLNAKQVQDLLLFQEIWVPSTEDSDAGPAFQPQSTEPQAYIVQRYQQVAAAPAFPWNSAVAIEKLEIQLDLGSSLGKAQLAVNDLWVSSKKNSDREQTLSIGFKSTVIESKGRMSGLVELEALKISTSIQWPDNTPDVHSVPLIQASIAFQELQAKVSFEWQPFLVANISKFDFLMYNVRGTNGVPKERLFSILEGDKVQVFCTSLTASQCLALIQAWQRLAQDKQTAYEASLREVERYLRRRTSVFTEKMELQAKELAKKAEDIKSEKAPISLHTGVVVSINMVNLGVFPSSFFDNQIFKLEAHDAQARFNVSPEDGKIHSALGLTLGQLRVALSGISRPSSADIEELLVSEIANRAIGSRGGTILKVPRLVASMETWQTPGIPRIEYVFRSTFEGKVDVGWNYSRISFIRDMWERHSNALTSRLGKPLQPSAVRITRAPGTEGDGDKHDEKITAVVNVPQSKYTYTALEPPVIETPQLRDMGEATPPLEWIGLQRDKLPNITHQIIIVTLLEIAKEVEDAYGKILGSS
ncbi:putative fermentation associated protein (Csf1) [Aspergillus clavatus NRRL 1]|uniref:Fermentation associated protein (Csf1), putative n=1 Tax=Aspergillus clavatus (strain ATCC 1007 / CBS 513.65 / DSM 816 / NCTC 3887 / NRRL 1 / QM 1276 / 107) TaxID=344612 RepID=A1C7J5_ASPCL|nr:fermentation associated protein (Csf1), putative [Aspergillus clavatus NRRL 1]EAW14366.1 fermentation associated protein (Csf1), putative [Aspergillus clavatus NRRL 1]